MGRVPLTDKEKAIIKKWYSLKTNKEIANMCFRSSGVKRTENTIKSLAYIKGYTSKNNLKVIHGGYSISDVVALTGIKKGNLFRKIHKGHYEGIYKQGQKTAIPEEVFEKILEEYPPDIPKGYIHVKEAASRIGMIPYSLTRSLKHNNFKYFKVGQNYYWPEELITCIVKQLKRTGDTMVDYSQLPDRFKDQ